ncbi:uncharacterized protein LOC142058244 [Phalacrocorax aristotelis]|uniref:uncharacterized protein LOC142058244 n=1 Tax=Phalacrocorax aristotelis TaxID=126867 RepID=UPI003F4C4FBA
MCWRAASKWAIAANCYRENKLTQARSGRPLFAGRSAPLRASPAAADADAAADAVVADAAAAAAPPPARPAALEAPVPASAGRGACAPLRPCGGAERPAERCGATNSAEQEETSALLADKASHGVVTGAARPGAPAPRPWLCLSAAAFPPGKVARARTPEPVSLCQAFGAFGLGSRLLLEEETQGSVAWQVPARPGSPCSSLSPPERAARGTAQPRSQLENKVRPG